MLPDQQFDGIPSKVPTPPWTPLVWQKGPDVLVAEAQSKLWTDQHDIVEGALNDGENGIAGSEQGVENESEQVIDGSTFGDSPSGPDKGGRAQQWNSMLTDLYDTEPRLSGWGGPGKMGPSNPAP